MYFHLLPIPPVAHTVLLRQPASKLQIPAFTAYAEPDPDALQFSEQEGVSGWKDAKQSLVWYGSLHEGTFRASLTLRLPQNASTRLALSFGKTTAVRTITGDANQSVHIDFGEFRVTHAGYHRLKLQGKAKSGETFGRIEALELSGKATEGAHFSLVERRNAASVHLGYPLPPQKQAAWYYQEVTVKTTPLWSFYMACGFRRGYFGIQVNSPTERRIIFSVWDSGNEAIDRNKVQAENRVQLLAKGEGVIAESFGNEGTGGHSHLVYPWKPNTTYRFLVNAKPDKSTTIYSAYFFSPESHSWQLVTRFRAPKDGGYLQGLHSFNENFVGGNGQLRRLAEFHNGWVRTPTGEWIELTTARFTHDSHGKSDRKDYAAGATKSGFYLSNGGFLAEPIQLGDKIERSATGTHPQDSELPE